MERLQGSDEIPHLFERFVLYCFCRQSMDPSIVRRLKQHLDDIPGSYIKVDGTMIVGPNTKGTPEAVLSTPTHMWPTMATLCPPPLPFVATSISDTVYMPDPIMNIIERAARERGLSVELFTLRMRY